MSIPGADVSHWTPIRDAHALAGAVDFIYAKATEGTSYVDPTYLEHATAARAAGIYVGAYHFLTSADPVLQARHFASVIGKPGSGYLPPVVDFEGPVFSLGAAECGRRLRAFQAEVDRLTGRRCGIYLSDSVVGWLGAAWPTVSTGRVRWIAHYGAKPTSPCHIWQSDAAGSLAGIGAGMCDIDQWLGTANELAVLAHDAPTPRTLRLTLPRMTGADVKALQAKLGHLATDGVFGPATDAAVRSWQKSHHLTTDGIVGPLTRKALGL